MYCNRRRVIRGGGKEVCGEKMMKIEVKIGEKYWKVVKSTEKWSMVVKNCIFINKEIARTTHWSYTVITL